MPSVCVIGGGTAGAEAAREAAQDGARVTVFERSPVSEPPWESWPDLIRAGSTNLPCGLLPPEATVLRTNAKAVNAGSVLRPDGSWMRFDVVVAATGSAFAAEALPGSHKPGVRVLSSAEEYSALGRSRGSTSRLVVEGEGARALQVADRISGNGKGIRVVVPRWRNGDPSPDVLNILEAAAEERGVSIAGGRVSRAIGEGSLEAVVVDGSVVCCDSLAVIPGRIPRPVPADANLGRGGGLAVDRNLRTSSRSLLAAGGCAELPLAPFSSRTFDEEPRASGRIAGANSLGHNLTISEASRWSVCVFGLRWTRVGEARPWPNPAMGTVSREWGPDSACTITFNRVLGRVMRIEWVEPERAPPAEAPDLSVPASLRSLAYGSSDISLVSDTARLAIRLWSDS